MPRNAHDTIRNATGLAKFPNQINKSKGKLLASISRGLNLVKDGKVDLIPNWEQHGWASTKRCFDKSKLLELYFESVPVIPQGLADVFPGIPKAREHVPTFPGVHALLARSHKATDIEERCALKGDVLKLLHDPAKPAAKTFFPGRLPKRLPHNLGFRRKDGPLTEKDRDSLQMPTFNISDPYQPKMKC